MGKPDYERQVFAAFIGVAPEFAGEEIVKWDLTLRDPPDIQCTTITGRAIGVELKELTQEAAMRARKPYRTLSESAKVALADLPPNRCENIAFVAYTPRPGTPRIKPNDAVRFREEFLDLVAEVDGSWNRDWNDPRSRRISMDKMPFKAGYPVIAKYLQAIYVRGRFNRFGEPSDEACGDYWIGPRPQGDTYDPNWFGKLLPDLVSKSVKKYREKPFKQSYEDVHLLIHADDNFVLYNDPVAEEETSYAEHVRNAQTAINAEGISPFVKAFLFVWVQGQQAVFRSIHRADDTTARGFVASWRRPCRRYVGSGAVWRLCGCTSKIMASAMSGYYDTRQVCLYGHVITETLGSGGGKDFCPKCGQATISTCPGCRKPIEGDYVGGSVTIVSFRGYDPPQAFCQYCGKPYPWTEKKIEAADELADEMEGLSADDREILKTSIHDLVQQGPHQEVAEIRFKKVIKKAGDEGVALARATLHSVLSEVVFKRLFGG